ncbi:hypothetical protein PIB30_040922 [Stylosanthes scabra]|uniref:Uncharacterized protein n=1 Tax=Stylosanthes scabra TaxID=79078 RepID=A0ABU6XGH2_9FABA|nr:hypothetical protein [Stylosanthes scabra]
MTEIGSFGPWYGKNDIYTCRNLSYSTTITVSSSLAAVVSYLSPSCLLPFSLPSLPCFKAAAPAASDAGESGTSCASRKCCRHRKVSDHDSARRSGRRKQTHLADLDMQVKTGIAHVIRELLHINVGNGIEEAELGRDSTLYMENHTYNVEAKSSTFKNVSPAIFDHDRIKRIEYYGVQLGMDKNTR